MAVQEIHTVDIVKDVVAAMMVPVYPSTDPVTYYTFNFLPGTSSQVLDRLINMDLGDLSALKYPLVAMLMPISEKVGSGFLEVTFPRIVLAHFTKTGDNTQPVLEAYSNTNVIKKILRPSLREFMNRMAWSIYTNMGDPDAYDYTYREYPSQQKIGDGLNDFVDVIEILNLKATIFTQIKTC